MAFGEIGDFAHAKTKNNLTKEGKVVLSQDWIAVKSRRSIFATREVEEGALGVFSVCVCCQSRTSPRCSTDVSMLRRSRIVSYRSFSVSKKTQYIDIFDKTGTKCDKIRNFRLGGCIWGVGALENVLRGVSVQVGGPSCRV